MCDVTITLDQATHSIIVNPDIVTCHRGEQITWIMPVMGSTVRLSFPPPPHHPFTDPPPFEGSGIISTQIEPNATVGNHHKYTVEGWIGADIYPPVDPTVIIANGFIKDGNGDEEDERKTLIEASHRTEELLQQVLNRVTKAVESAEGTKFFPDGIDYISVDVEVTPVKVMLTVSGPKSKGT